MNNSACNLSPEQKTWGITWKDKTGYFLGQFGSIMLYMGVSNFLTLYFTDVALLPMSMISIIFLVSRLWDAINDPILGRIADNLNPTKKGKYHRWMWAVPINCIAFALLFLEIPGLSTKKYFIWALIIYNIYGMASTCCSVPFGSLANMATSDGHERTTLTTFRGAAEAIGGALLVVAVPLFIYSKDASGTQYVDGSKFSITMAVVAVVSCIAYMSVFAMVKERVPSEQKKTKINLLKIAKVLFTDKAFLVFVIVNVLFMAAPMYVQNCTQYICLYYFDNGTIYSLLSATTIVARLIVLALTGKLAKRFGKKLVTAAGMFLATGSYLALFLLHTNNLTLFAILAFVAAIGESFLTYLVWAMITDVIENFVQKSGFQEVSTAYAFIMFFRKIGTTLAGVAVPAVLSSIGYVAGNVSDTVANSLYNAGMAGGALIYLAIAILLAALYPLGKKQVDAMYANRKN